MKKVIASGFLCILCFALSAQTAGKQNDSLSKEDFLKFQTIEEALKLPSVYKVVSYTIVHSNKGEINKSGMNPGSMTYPLRISQFADRIKRGDAVSFEEIVVNKGDKTIKLMSKTYFIM